MKSNIFTITLALCLGLSSTIHFCSLQGYQGYPQYQPGSFQQQPIYRSTVQQPLTTSSVQYDPATTTPQATSTWRGWLSPSAWWASARSAAQSAAGSTLDMANAIRRGVGLENVSYKTLGAAIAALAALNYNKQTILSVVSSVYDAVAPTASAVASGITTVVTNKQVMLPAVGAGAAATLHIMDKTNKERKEEREKKQGLQTRRYQ